MTDYQIAILNDGEFRTLSAIREEAPSGGLKSISAVLPKVGTITWRNPFAECKFSDEQIAVATVLRGMAKAIAESSRPIYTPEEFLTDIEIVQAFRYSAEAGGRTISLPLNEKMEKARRLASIGFWNSKIFKLRRDG